MIHRLKTLQPYFDDVKSGKKPFEIRVNDRDYQVGDPGKYYELDREYHKKQGLCNACWDKLREQNRMAAEPGKEVENGKSRIFECL